MRESETPEFELLFAAIDSCREVPSIEQHDLLLDFFSPNPALKSSLEKHPNLAHTTNIILDDERRPRVMLLAC